MISKEKLYSSIHKAFRTFFFQFIFWEVAFLLYVFFVGDNQIIKVYTRIPSLDSIYVELTFLSFFNSILFSLIDILFSDRIMRIFPVQLMVFLKSIFYFASAFLLFIIAAIPSIESIRSIDYSKYFNELPSGNINLLRFLVFFYMACFFNSFFNGVIKKIGKGNFKNWAFGFLNKPLEQERIFMFIDLKGSTSIAEKLGHKKFSYLVQDLFNDLTIVDNYGGEIYQYLGDGAIISWNLKTGLVRNNFLRAYFAYSRVLELRKRYYTRKYALQPKFKAGVHVGKVMVLQVGQIRRDISYNGDTMNTAARIESQCNELRQNLLISGNLYDLIEDKKMFRFKNVGNIQLRGKKKGVDIYGVRTIAK